MNETRKMNEHEYRSFQAVNSSSLKHALKSPAHYWHALQNPMEQTPQMQIGTAIHTLLLEPDLFASQFTIAEIDRRTKEGKALALQAEQEGKIILNLDAGERVMQAASAVKANGEAMKYIKGGREEQSFIWTDVDTGVLCKARPDFLHNGRIVVDLKSSQDASMKGFQASIAKFMYHIQAAFYLDGVSQVTGQAFTDFVFVVVESSAPYGVATYTLDHQSIEIGRSLYKEALKIISNCRIDAHWPSYPEKLQTITVPAWAYYAAQDIIASQ